MIGIENKKNSLLGFILYNYGYMPEYNRQKKSANSSR